MEQRGGVGSLAVAADHGTLQGDHADSSEPTQPSSSPDALPPIPAPLGSPQRTQHSLPTAGWDRNGARELPNGLPVENHAGSGPLYKRGRGRSFFKEQPKKGAVCQVPGCDHSLHKLRDYYKRYKICPHHLELPCLVVEGQTIRFCQQCGRFQLLTDFEGDRRSCRRKLDKHNERRRKAEAEQKALMLDSGSDSPGGSMHVAKAPRPSPYRGGAVGAPGSKGFASQLPLMMGAGADDVTTRLKQLAAEPSLQDLSAGLLQTLANPSPVAGMDWLATAGTGQPPPQSPPMPQNAAQVLPSELLALLPVDVQQQVLQQGPGILDNALVMQLQQVAGAAPPAAPAAHQLPPSSAQPFGFGLFGNEPVGQVQPPPLLSLPAYGSFTAPGLSPPASGLFNLSEQHLQQRHHHHHPQYAHPLHQRLQQRPESSPQGFPAAQVLLSTGVTAANASTFLQKLQPQEQHAAHPSPQGGIPVLRCGSVQQTPVPDPAEAAADASDKAALLVALARSLGVSTEQFARALRDGSMAGFDNVAAIGAASQQQQQQGPDSRYTNHMQVSPATQPSMGLPAMDSMPDSSGGAVTSSSAGQQPDAALHSQHLKHQHQPEGSSAAAAAGGGTSCLMDLNPLHSAVQNGRLSAGFASDANLLLQLVKAVEVQQQAGVGSERMHSLSLKLFNCTPNRLPKNILEELQEWMVQNKTLFDGATRPGCVQLSLAALLNDEEVRHLTIGFAGLVQQLMRHALADLHTGVLAQMGRQAVLVDSEGRWALQLDLANSDSAVPEICSVRPLAVTPGYGGPILVTGRHVGGPGDTIYCRNGGSYPTTEVLGHGMLLTSPEGLAGDMSWALLRIPSLQEGCHQVEVQHGMFVSAPHSLMVLDDEEAVAELRQLELEDASVRDVPELLHRLGAVLRFGRSWNAAASSEALRRRVGTAAQELAATCILHRWGAVLRLVLPMTCMHCTPEDAVVGVEHCLCSIPLLHAGVLMGGPEVVRALGAWASYVGYSLRLDATWGGDLTALHMAMLVREPEEVAIALTKLSPATAAEHWAASFAQHGKETPLGMACRLNKRGLLRALAQHGVPMAGALLAAMVLQDELVPQAPVGVQHSSWELDLQRRQWTNVYGSLHGAAAAPKAPGFPLGSPTPELPHLPYRHYCSDRTGFLCTGDEFLSSMLLPFGLPRKAPHVLGKPAAESGRPPAASEGKANKWATYKASGGVGAALTFKHGAGCTAPAWGGQEGDWLPAPAKFKAGMHGFAGYHAKRQLYAWCPLHFSKVDASAHVLAVMLVCAIAMAAVVPLRRPLHAARLLATVVHTPLMFQPVLLLCPSVQLAYHTSRATALAAVHVTLLGLQYWAAYTHGTDWLLGNAVLASHPAGLWLLVAVFSLQLRFALHMPTLLMAYGANVMLLTVACRCTGACVSPLCVLSSAFSTVQMFGVSAVLPLLSGVWWLLGALAHRGATPQRIFAAAT